MRRCYFVHIFTNIAIPVFKPKGDFLYSIISTTNNICIKSSGNTVLGLLNGHVRDLRMLMIESQGTCSDSPRNRSSNSIECLINWLQWIICQCHWFLSCNYQWFYSSITILYGNLLLIFIYSIPCDYCT